jgi:hypothetical protein
MRRLLLIRELQEEQSRLALELGLGELHRLEKCLAAAVDRDRRGRQLVVTSARTGELADRLAGLEEERIGIRSAAQLRSRIGAAEEEAAELRQAFLDQRVERRQAETLIEETEARDEVVAARRNQQALDDWHRTHLAHTGSGGGTDRKQPPISAVGRGDDFPGGDSRDKSAAEESLENIEIHHRPLR